MVLVNFLLNRFLVLLWPTLSVISVIFAIVMLDILSRLTSSEESVHLKSSETILDEVMRLQSTIERTAVRGETQSTLVEKLRSVSISLVSARLKLTKEEFDAVIDQNPEAAIQLIKDQEMLALLSGKTVNLSDLQRIDAILTKIEGM
jgi:hypothetical protein